MFRTLIVVSCILALSLATPVPEKQQDAKKTDKRSPGAYHYSPAASAIGYHSGLAVAAPAVAYHASAPVAAPAIAYHASAPVAAPAIAYHASAPIVAPAASAIGYHASLPVASSAYYSAPSVYSSAYPSYGYSGFSGYHGFAAHNYGLY